MKETADPVDRYFAPELLLLAQDVRVAFLDVDGVLTDGAFISPKTAKRSSDSAAWTVMVSRCCNAQTSRRSSSAAGTQRLCVRA
jgi:hypothetical protein